MPDISVLIATYNRAEVLRQTLNAICAVDREGLKIEFVVIDNNSTDGTGGVIDSFKDRLPIIHLHQPKQGKSSALNLALGTAELGDIVVFTDDDVVPREDWLQQIAQASARWPDFSIFGGKIDIVWPTESPVPDWAVESDFIRGTVLAEHDLGCKPRAYTRNEHPFGPNWWIRGELLTENLRFDVDIGPQSSAPTGEEVAFIENLYRDGWRAFYAADATVGHLAEPSYLVERGVYRRIRKAGSGRCYSAGIMDAERFDKNRIAWYVRRVGSIIRCRLSAIQAALLREERTRVPKCAVSLYWYAYHLESLRLASRGHIPQSKNR